jgi:2,4-dienoyl-CoA reductase-like NADH-dependent reductase (Old Yellow Enzyme family)
MLFSRLELRGIVLPNRVVLGPMQMYMAKDGFASDWHEAHLGTYARGGFGTVFTEALAVDPVGRATYGDMSAWSDEHVPGLKRLAAAIRRAGGVPAAQLWHAGAKASRRRQWNGPFPLTQEDSAKGEPPWQPVAPSAAARVEGWRGAHPLTLDEIAAIRRNYVDAARRCDAAGFEVIELHAAHGYLLHQFYSRLGNGRTDAYGGDRAGRMRLALEIAAEVRQALPRHKLLFVRVSCIDDEEVDGWGLGDTVVLVRALKERGVDVIDCSSGGIGMSPGLKSKKRGAGFQVPLAAHVKKEAGIAVMAVGMIRKPEHADGILHAGNADLICIAREALFNPFWGLHAKAALEGAAAFGNWPHQYGPWLTRRASTSDETIPPQGLSQSTE